jgi:hypothetical protein
MPTSTYKFQTPGNYPEENIQHLCERYHLEDAGVDGRMILKWIFKKWEGTHVLNLCGFR